MTSTSDGRDVVIETSRILNDDVLTDLHEDQLEKIQYHVKTCCGRYKKSDERHKIKQLSEKRPPDENCTTSELPSPGNRYKRRKSVVQCNPRKKPFIICDKIKCKGSNERFRIEDSKRATNFINAYNFNKLYNSAKELFAADFMYHTSCMEGYLLKF